MLTPDAILRAVRDRFGISLTEVGTGGGCMALHARLESGHWIVATDEGLCGFAERCAFEALSTWGHPGREDPDYAGMGWSVGIYDDHGEDMWFGAEDSLVNVIDYDMYAADLPDMVGRALALLVTTR